MRNERLCSIGICLFLVLGLVPISCSSGRTGKSWEGIEGLRTGSVTATQIEQLRLGMTMEETAAVLAPATPHALSVPALLYDASPDGSYYLEFYDPFSPSAESQGDTLRRIIFFSHDGTGVGKYVLPELPNAQFLLVDPDADKGWWDLFKQGGATSSDDEARVPSRNSSEDME